MKRVCDECLAGAGFPVDQDMAIRLPQIKNVFAQTVHHGRCANQLLHYSRAVGQFAPKRPVVERQAAGIRGLFRQLRHPIGIEGLFEEVEGAHPHRFHRHGHIPVPGDHDDRQSAVDTHQAFEKSHPVHARHLDVAYHDTRIIVAHRLQRVFSAGKGLGVETG